MDFSRGELSADDQVCLEESRAFVRTIVTEDVLRRAYVPWVTFGTTATIARPVQKFGSEDLGAEVMPGGYSGQVRMCLGATSRPS